MLSLTFLGVGSAFAKRNYNSNLLIEHWHGGRDGSDEQEAPDDALLVDFGVTGPLALHQLSQRPEYAYLDANGQIDYGRINYLLVTHQHADHIGGIEELALVRTFLLNKPGDASELPSIVSPSSILIDLWDTSLKGGLSPLPGRYATLADFFNIVSLKPSQAGVDPFVLEGRYRFEFFATDHIRIKRKHDWPSYGIEIFDNASGRSVFYSGDTRFDPETYGHRMERADLCFHDVQLNDDPRSVHAMLSDLRSLPATVKSKTHLFHYGDQWDDDAFAFVPREFAGFAVAQRRYHLFA